MEETVGNSTKRLITKVQNKQSIQCIYLFHLVFILSVALY